ncbi:ZIP family metal transporter [Nocardioides hwasunensis]|uniref:ZIP family metal transporter n=1 Tax=Nocardioides hwasunensis TaxID=397258 RepID=A0ABR8MFF8_9ACTN|nr:ZIP family metal transporter [Nocardioides hwasunensis]MBD3914814.1 ZIP family metal transporter [Nocardioides hwasunensis]
MLLAFTLTLLAGAATAVGGLIAVHGRVRSDRGLAIALAFAGGAMVLVSLVEILPKGAASLAPALGIGGGWLATLGAAALGAVLAVLLGRVVPVAGHDHDHGRGRDAPGTHRLRQLPGVRRSGLVVAIAVTAHNLPEGLATFVATLDDPAAGATLAVAIALHNIPEGVAVAAPFYGSGASRRKAVGIAALSGLAEPIGALAGYLLLAALLPGAAFGVVFGLVAGVMLLIGLAELLPTALRMASPVPVAAACTAGVVVMALSLALLSLA